MKHGETNRERERERDTERERERQTDRQTDRDREREIDRQTKRALILKDKGLRHKPSFTICPKNTRKTLCVCVCVFKVYIYICFPMFHLFSSLARTSCYTGLNEPKLQSLENKVFEFEFFERNQ